uniref:Uncharacterized protein n=1 Tax=Leersia perrieri TaxID=77586 RepID=A0A0D9WID2_9ORYZ
MELFENARSVRLKSHLGTYLCVLDDDGGGGGGGVSHGYRSDDIRGTVWAVELAAGDDYVRLQSQRGLYLCATDLPAALDGCSRGSAACCWVIQSPPPSNPHDGAFLWTPRREGDFLLLVGLYGRLLRVRHENFAVTVEYLPDDAAEESSWSVEVVVPAIPRCRAASCDARMEAASSQQQQPPTSFARFCSAKETKMVRKTKAAPAASGAAVHRTIFYNTARDDGGVDDFDEGTWKYFTFKDRSLAALRRRLVEETRREDFVVCRRRFSAPPPSPGLFPVVLDLPPGNRDMEFVLVLNSSRVKY